MRGYDRRPYRQKPAYRYHRRRRVRFSPRFFILLAVIAAVILLIVFWARGDIFQFKKAEPSPSPTSVATPAPSPTPTPVPEDVPAAVSATLPENFGIQAKLNLDGQDVTSYLRTTPFSFGDTYTDMNGIITFRGSNYRQGATYGSATITDKKLTKVWTKVSGSLQKDFGSGYWSGSGWTGQPLIVKWPADMLAKMNLNEDKKDKEDLVEIIYATLDGEIYFLDLADGKKTRDNISVGVPFKGAGALDPRGYPLLYLGAGDAAPKTDTAERKEQEAYIYSLIDGSRLYSFGKYPDPFAPRDWTAFDSSALVDAGSDTLIMPGENGILYTMKLNTDYDAVAGTIGIAPSDILKMSYTTDRSRNGYAADSKNVENSSGDRIQQLEDSYWLGMEDSACAWKQWLYIADNAGTLLCIDTTTMTVVWAQDTLDDTNSTPVLEVVDGHPYLYISTSLHWTADENSKGTIPIWKIDGLTGEIVWQADFPCNTVSGLSGGAEGSGLLGTNDIANMIIYPIARTPDEGNGVLVSLDKSTGSEIWRYEMSNYPWSSPVSVYDAASNTTYVVICDTAGNMILLDGKTGTELDKLNIGSNVEASPAVYDNMLVVGTRDENIIGVKIS